MTRASAKSLPRNPFASTKVEVVGAVGLLGHLELSIEADGLAFHEREPVVGEFLQDFFRVESASWSRGVAAKSDSA